MGEILDGDAFTDGRDYDIALQEVTFTILSVFSRTCLEEVAGETLRKRIFFYEDEVT